VFLGILGGPIWCYLKNHGSFKAVLDQEFAKFTPDDGLIDIDFMVFDV